MSATAAYSHEESWLLLPWLANGRLSAAERARIELHLRGCPECTREVELQRRLRDTLTEPERVTYAPGPSFRKLMERIDAAPAARTAPGVTSAARARAAWRPPGLAWAASFVLLSLAGVLAATAYRWSQPLYVTHTEVAAATPGVLHVAFERSLPIGDAEQLLLSAGARVVEGPDRSGVFGVAPVADAAAPAQREAQLRALAARLRSESQVRWVEPLADLQSSDRGAESLPRRP
jgi:Putative zinc-finger